MLDATKVCKQCGWDRSQDAPPTQDPGDQKARVGVAAGLVVAYGVMFFLISKTDASARPARITRPANVVVEAPAYAPEPVTGAPVALGALPPGAGGAGANAKPGALLTIKVADAKSATIQGRDALQYLFQLPETDQRCQLVGQIRGIGGFAGNLETFLLTDDEYVFWNANPAAIPHSSWETVRGSETTLSYPLSTPGTYHLVISNVMSPSAKSVQVKAQVKCAK
ncbi:MAG: hypothetical protein M3P12_11465 [Gemmatimonadota bacterium]|nr:hypothetical protein [Gemmatimonadota bacterium]